MSPLSRWAPVKTAGWGCHVGSGASRVETISGFLVVGGGCGIDVAAAERPFWGWEGLRYSTSGACVVVVRLYRYRCARRWCLQW